MTPIDQLKQAINQKRAAGKTPVIYFNWDFYSSNKAVINEVVNGYLVYTIIENEHPDFVVTG